MTIMQSLASPSKFATPSFGRIPTKLSIWQILSPLAMFSVSYYISNVYIVLHSLLTVASGSSVSFSEKQPKSKPPLTNCGFKTTDDGRLIISEKSLVGISNDLGNDCSDSDGSSHKGQELGSANAKPGMDQDSSDEENRKQTPCVNRKRKDSDILSMPSRKTNTSRKGIHRSLGAKPRVVMSVKSELEVMKAASRESKTKKTKGDVKQSGKLDPYAYIPITLNTLNKR